MKNFVLTDPIQDVDDPMAPEIDLMRDAITQSGTLDHVTGDHVASRQMDTETKEVRLNTLD